jgi:4-methyl-5(b-hydroxyethyl)-thiazole monophosphate biosynthesis
MARATVVLADGFEEIEAVVVVDVLRRADVEVVIARVGEGNACGSHGISVVPDCRVEEITSTEFDAIILPGGMPGASNLRDDERVQRLVREFADAGKTVAAICAAPIALESAGILQGLRATSYPGFELPSATYCEERVVEDGHLVTSRGPGTALPFALRLVKKLVSDRASEQLRARMLVEG